MIEDLRFVEREFLEPRPDIGANVSQRVTKRILQAYDGHAWFDVPLFIEQPRNEGESDASRD